jgi:hypothetical protein
MRDLPPAARLPLLFFGMISLLAGVAAGLGRLGWEVPAPALSAAGWHGALMIPAFFGTVIGLERAVAIGRLWAYAAPAAAGLGGLCLVAGAPVAAAQGLALLAATVMLAASVQVLRRLTAPFTVVLALGAGCWLAGNLAWLADASPLAAVPWWLAFLVLTIAGERLELTRFLPTPPVAQRLFIAIVALILLGAALSLGPADAGLRLFAGGLLALAAWLLRYDIARRNARQTGLTRYIALCLLSGYVWLALAGALGLAGALAPGHPWRDAAIHALALGFVFAMVFGHAPIIFPAVARVKIPYHPVFYLPLLALHASLLGRVGGDLAGDFATQRGSAAANAGALLLFIATVVASVVRGSRQTPSAGATGPAP